MGVKDLKKYLKENKLIHEAKLTSLKNTRIGIDGFAWLSKHVSVEEAYHVSIGGLPLTLFSKIDDEIEKFKKAEIKPVFVFNGLWNKERNNAAIMKEREERETNKNTAWNSYERKQLDPARVYFLRVPPQLIEYLPSILQHFEKNQIEFFRAPYISWGQLSKFEAKESPFIHAIYGPNEVLMFHVNRLITDIYFETGTFQYVEKSEIIQATRLSNEQFLESCILSGSIINSTFKDIPLQPSSTFSSACELIKYCQNGLNALLSNGVSNDETIDQFLKTKCLVLSHPILDSTCVCRSYPDQNFPSDMNEVVGTRLPNDIYYLISQGIISTLVINNLLTGFLYESCPIVDSIELRESIDYLMPLRAAALNLLSSSLCEFYQNKPVYVVRWFGTNEKILIPRDKLQLNDLLAWNLNDEMIKSELEKLESKSVDLFVVTNTKFPSAKTENKLLTVNETVTSILLKYLQVIKYMDINQNHWEWNQFGKALQHAKKFPEQTLVILELIRGGLLSNKPFKPITPSTTIAKPKIENEDDIRLISRILSLIPAKCQDRAWSGPIDKDLATFNSFVKTLYRCHRNILDMLLAVMIINRRAQVSPTNLPLVSNKMPFFQESSTILGILAKKVLEESTSHEEPKKFMESIQSQFPEMVDPFQDLKEGISFWNQVLQVIRVLSKGNKEFQSVLSQFESADKFLSSKKKFLENM